jgi:hypothetical protein
MKYKVLNCGHCETQNAVALCDKCGRYFVVTQSHILGLMRTFESAASDVSLNQALNSAISVLVNRAA